MSGLIVTEHEYWPAATLDDTNPPHQVLDLGGSGATPMDIHGSNQEYAVLRFGDGSAVYALRHKKMPADWYVGAGVTLSLLWKTPATSGSARWSAGTAFVMPIDGDQDDLDAAFGPEVVALGAAASNADRLRKTDIALDLTDARAGALMFLYIYRDPTDPADDLGDDADLIGVELTYQRRMVLP